MEANNYRVSDGKQIITKEQTNILKAIARECGRNPGLIKQSIQDSYDTLMGSYN